ncbi:MAG: hypothetical protein ACI9CA_000337 [Natronomonas sp.]
MVALVGLISDMVNRRRFIAGLGSLAIGSGALMQSGAFSTVKGDRGVSVQTAADKDAILGLEGVDDPNTTPAFENNSTSSMEVTLKSTDSSVEFDENGDGSFTDTAKLGLNPGDKSEVVINGNGDSVPVSVTAKLPDRSDPEATISLTRDYAVPVQADQIQLTSNLNAAGNSGKYEFEIENTGNTEVTVVGIRIEDTSTNAEEVANKNGSTLVAGGTGVLSNPIPVDSENPDRDTRRDFDSNSTVSLSGGATENFKFDRFQDSAGKKVGMQNQSVTVKLYFSDGSSEKVTIEP